MFYVYYWELWEFREKFRVNSSREICSYLFSQSLFINFWSSHYYCYVKLENLGWTSVGCTVWQQGTVSCDPIHMLSWSWSKWRLSTWHYKSLSQGVVRAWIRTWTCQSGTSRSYRDAEDSKGLSGTAEISCYSQGCTHTASPHERLGCPQEVPCCENRCSESSS